MGMTVRFELRSEREKFLHGVPAREDKDASVSQSWDDCGAGGTLSAGQPA